MPEFFSPSEGRSGNWLDWSSLVRDGQMRPPSAWSMPEAFFCVLFCAAACDDQMAREERGELLALVHRSRALKTLSEEALSQMSASVAERLQNSDEAFAEACAALAPDVRVSAFAHALDIVLSDGDLSEDESKFLNALVSHFNMDEKTVRNIADVITLKNKY